MSAIGNKYSLTKLVRFLALIEANPFGNPRVIIPYNNTGKSFHGTWMDGILFGSQTRCIVRACNRILPIAVDVLVSNMPQIHVLQSWLHDEQSRS